MTNINDLNRAIRNATADGYVADYEARNIEKLALKDDNNVNEIEKSFLKDVFDPKNDSPNQSGAYFTPTSKRIFQYF